jgi:hypothetical protein
MNPSTCLGSIHHPFREWSQRGQSGRMQAPTGPGAVQPPPYVPSGSTSAGRAPGVMVASLQSPVVQESRYREVS